MNIDHINEELNTPELSACCRGIKIKATDGFPMFGCDICSSCRNPFIPTSLSIPKIDKSLFNKKEAQLMQEAIDHDIAFSKYKKEVNSSEKECELCSPGTRFIGSSCTGNCDCKCHIRNKDASDEWNENMIEATQRPSWIEEFDNLFMNEDITSSTTGIFHSKYMNGKIVHIFSDLKFFMTEKIGEARKEGYDKATEKWISFNGTEHDKSYQFGVDCGREEEKARIVEMIETLEHLDTGTVQIDLLLAKLKKDE